MITPDGGPGSMIMTLPLVILTELGVIVAKRYEKGRTTPSRLQIFESSKCRFCGKEMAVDVSFCTDCGRAQK